MTPQQLERGNGLIRQIEWHENSLLRWEHLTARDLFTGTAVSDDAFDVFRSSNIRWSQTEIERLRTELKAL